MDTQTAVEAVTQDLGRDDRRELAETMRRALSLSPGPSGPLDAALRRRFAEAVDILAS